MSHLEISGLSKSFGPLSALAGIDLAVPLHSRTAIVGPSGSGKTTLLRIIAGFEAPDAGRVTLDGQVLADGPLIVPPHLRGIGYMAQDGALFPHLSVADNIGFGISLRNPARERRVRELMDLVELDRSMLERRPHELSGGQQQRVALARALARRPGLMLLDEPFSALDAGLRDAVRKSVMRVLGEAGITAILVTHDQAEALTFADQLAVLRQGRLVQAGPPRTLYWQPEDRDTARFLGDATILDATLGEGFADCLIGRVPLAPGLHHGRGEIMLRPEQLRIEPAPPKGDAARADDAGGCHGIVEEVEFGGALCAVIVAIETGGTTARILVRASAIDLPQTGDRVRIAVIGRGHLLR